MHLDDRLAGLVLCGGRSSRMGRPKAWLELDGEPLLARATRIVSTVCAPVAVCAGPAQDLPALPGNVAILRDAREGEGPLVGIAHGIRNLAGSASRIFVTATDMPGVTANVIEALAARAAPGSVVCLSAHGRTQPLCAVYPASVAPSLQAAVAAGERRLMAFIASVSHIAVDAVDLGVDPDVLGSVNTPEDWQRVRQLLARGR